MTGGIRGAHTFWRAALAGIVLLTTFASSAFGAPGSSPPSMVPGSHVDTPIEASLGQQGAQGAVLFHEDFTDNRSGWSEHSSAYFAEDGYHLVTAPLAAGGTYTFQPQRTVRGTDVSVEVTIQQLEGDDNRFLGVAVRSTTLPRQGYLLFVNPQLGQLGVSRAGSDGSSNPYAIPWHRSDAINRDGSPNTLRLVARGKTLSVFVNGVQVAWAQDESFLEAGAAQIIVGDSQHVVVRSFTVREATEQEVTPLAIQPPLFEDHFFDNRERWNLADDMTIQLDGLHLDYGARSPGLYWSVPRTSPFFTDVAVEADITFAGGREASQFGVVLRGSRSTGYLLLISAEGSFSVMSWMDGRYTQLIPWRRTIALRPGPATNVIKLVARGSNVIAYANGTLLGAVEDTGVTDAGWAYLASTNGPHIIVRRFTVTLPTPVDLAPVATPTRPSGSPTPSPQPGQATSTPAATATATAPAQPTTTPQRTPTRTPTPIAMV